MLYHFSEDPGIELFVPRAPLAHPEHEPLVWTIDEWHAPLYFFPRDCPRAAFWPVPTTTEDDLAAWWRDPTLRMTIAIEYGWLERLETVPLYRYSFPPDGFLDTGDHGVHVSREAARPVQVERLEDPLARLEEASVELRLLPSLVGLGERLVETSLHYSMIRMRNAVGWRLGRGKPTGAPVAR